MRLLSEHEDVLAEFNTGQVAVPEDGGWMEVILQSRGRGRGRDILGGSSTHGSLAQRGWTAAPRASAKFSPQSELGCARVGQQEQP